MSQVELEAKDPRAVEAKLTYTVRTKEKPVSGSMGPGTTNRIRTGTYEDHAMPVHNGRRAPENFTLDENGFELVNAPSRVQDFFDEKQVKDIYYRECVDLIKKLSGANRVEVFDHTIRTGYALEQKSEQYRETVKYVHNDYTEWSAEQRVRNLFPDEADDLIKRRFAIIQIWRPITKPVEAEPLAICDATSMKREDLIAVERRYPDRVGEIYHLAYNPEHRWYYFPKMTRDEALVFKVYDSATDGRARFTGHGAFDDPTTPSDAPPRESMEIRALAFFKTP